MKTYSVKIAHVTKITSKMKPCLKNLTPHYFCDMWYFRKVGLHQIFFKNTFIKKIIGLAPWINGRNK